MPRFRDHGGEMGSAEPHAAAPDTCMREPMPGKSADIPQGRDTLAVRNDYVFFSESRDSRSFP